MKVALKVIEDNRRRKTFIFASFADAQRFLNFTNTYYDETGCGNGYSAYLPNFVHLPFFHFLPAFTSVPIPCIKKVNREKNRLNFEFVSDMLWNILRTRLAVNEPDINDFPLTTESTNQGIKFVLGELPKPKRPNVGDRYRIPRSKLLKDSKMFEFQQGIILQDLGDKFKVTTQIEMRLGKSDPKTYLIDADRVIKIHDWVRTF